MLARFKELLHHICKDLALGVEVGRPAVGVVGHPFAADFKGFFEVGVNGAEGLDEGFVGELGYFFAAVGDVAAVGFGGCLGY